jgi:hypothetical protein
MNKTLSCRLEVVASSFSTTCGDDRCKILTGEFLRDDWITMGIPLRLEEATNEKAQTSLVTSQALRIKKIDLMFCRTSVTTNENPSSRPTSTM